MYNHLSVSLKKPTDEKWRKQPFCHHAQLWSQLLLLDSIVCCHYCLGPDLELITVPQLLCTLQLYQAQNVCGAGKQKHEKTILRPRLDAHQVGMAIDVNKYCQNCIVCHQHKLPKVPVVSLPVGRP